MKAHLCFAYAGGLPWDYLIRHAESQELLAVPHPMATHVYFLFTDDPDGDVIIEAVPPKVVRLSPAPHRPGVRQYPLADGADALALYAYAYSQVGQTYDLPGLLVALGFAARKEQDHFYQQHHNWVFCSELATDTIRKIRPCLDGVDADCITPAHLEAWACAQLPSADKETKT